MKAQKTSSAWQQYEAGRDYKRRIGLYETVRENERFWRGDQWRGGGELPHPVFNIVRRIVDYLVCTAAVGDVRISYGDDNLLLANSADAAAVSAGIDALNGSAAYRWERQRLARLIYRLLTDAALAGDGVIYCAWDPDAEGVGEWHGDVVTQAVDSVNLFVADVTSRDIQNQEYIMLSGRAPVGALRAEARRRGVPEADIASIIPDDIISSSDVLAGEYGAITTDELPDGAPATYIIKFWRENGRVVFEKSTRGCVIHRAETGCRLYPVAYFPWYESKNCFIGTAPASGLIANQKYINRAYAMMMKHMTDTAFSKVIYDRTRIPEWSNEVGQAIAAVGGGNIADAVQVVGTGEMQNGYLELINNAVAMTKELAGATETALGNTDPTNTSAILALRETSIQSLERVRASLYICLEEMAAIWADMICAYCPDGRPLRTADGIAELPSGLLRRALLRARIDVTDSSRFSSSGTQSILDALLSGGHITFTEYLERLPEGVLPDVRGLLEARVGITGITEGDT